MTEVLYDSDIEEMQLRAQVLAGTAPEDAPSTWRIRIAEAGEDQLAELEERVDAIPDRTLRTYARRELQVRRPPRREWSGFSQPCPLCHETMSMVLEGGREVYECPDCLAELGERQLELFG